jgi:hypothetical protein
MIIGSAFVIQKKNGSFYVVLYNIVNESWSRVAAASYANIKMSVSKYIAFSFSWVRFCNIYTNCLNKLNINVMEEERRKEWQQEGKIKEIRKDCTYEFKVHKSQCMYIKFHVRMTRGKYKWSL